jgi:hypothetical protein
VHAGLASPPTLQVLTTFWKVQLGPELKRFSALPVQRKCNDQKTSPQHVDSSMIF